VVLVLGIFGRTWQAVRANRLRIKAEANEQKAIAAEAKETQQRQKAELAQANKAQQRRQAEAQAYVANIRLMQEAAEQNDVRQFRESLQETASNPARGFVWYYWQRQMHLDLRTLHGHSGGVRSVAFSPDGQRIVTCSQDGTAKAWDAASGKELVTFKGHRGWINSVAFAPDGQRIATGDNDATVRVG
jgi:hypothetical protein